MVFLGQVVAVVVVGVLLVEVPHSGTTILLLALQVEEGLN
jgi:hypothetical protein